MYFIKHLENSCKALILSQLVSPEGKAWLDALNKTQPTSESIPSWVKKMSPETQKKYNEVQLKNPNGLQELSQMLDTLGWAITFLTNSQKSLKLSLESAVKTWKLNASDPEDKAFLDTALSSLEKRIGEKANFESELNVLLDWLIWNKKESLMSQAEKPKELQTMWNKEFLNYSPAERLKYITKNNVDASQISNGAVKSVEFTFTFDGVNNKELYMKTTAGQVLPAEVGSVVVWWETFSRNSISWEFFNSANKRLTIHEWTDLTIATLRTPEEMKKIAEENTARVKEYLAQNTDANPDIVNEAIKRWIDPKFANLVFKNAYEKTPENERKVVLEQMFTEFDRARGRFWNDLAMTEWRYDERLSFALLRQFNWKDWKEKAENFWFKKERIERDTVYEAKGEGHKPYVEAINTISSQYDVPADKIIQLIYHENAKWNPNIKAPGSSAYGLGQMIDSTWWTYGKWLDRNNPVDQLEATARYMRAIYDRQWCSWEEVLAYYNTGEWIKRLSLAQIAEFTRLNPAIAAKHPDRNPANADEYFKSAVAYYNDMNYSEVA